MVNYEYHYLFTADRLVLKNMCVQFLECCYNPLMKIVRGKRFLFPNGGEGRGGEGREGGRGGEGRGEERREWVN